MKIRFLAALFIGFTPFIKAPAADSAVASFVSDPSRILENHERALTLAAKLQTYEHTTGIKMLVEFHTKSPTGDEDKIPGEYMQTLATKHGIARDGVLAVYFADDPDWRLWIGDDLTARFVGKPGTAKALTESGQIHETKEALFTATWKTVDESLAAKQKPDLTSSTERSALRVSLQAHALVDAVMLRLAPKAK